MVHPGLRRAQSWVLLAYDKDFPFVTSTNDIEMVGSNFEVAPNAVRKLRENEAQVVVAITHIGVEEDFRLAQAVPGIDIIFGGHSHDYIPKVLRTDGTLIVNGGEKGSAFVRLDVTTDEHGRLDLKTPRFELVSIDESVAPDSAIETILEDYKDVPGCYCPRPN